VPAWLLWLSGIPIATVGAIAWSAWSGRARGPEKALDSVQAYERFRAAMANPTPGLPPRREPGRDGDSRG